MTDADDTIQIPDFVGRPRNPYRFERTLFAWLCLAYFMAGGILSFACLELAAAAEMITTAPLCRRL